MNIYDSMARTEVELDIPRDRVVKVFVCGPTVYDTSHVGHARTYVFFDSFVKYLRVTGYNVFYLQNITDIDDKIINRANEEKVSYESVAKRYTAEYLSLMKLLNVDSVNFYAKATSHIDEIIEQIAKLVELGMAYETSDGVYFSVSGFSDFGKLSGQKMEELRAGARVEASEEKRDQRDFALWKKMKPGEPFWDSPWGKGRPGWHVEDTSITEAYFGPQYDIHGAGTDLIFPHHEAEIAIERSISGKSFLSKYWLHSGMINVNEAKMSKSLKNYVTIRQVLNDFTPEELRFALLNAHYRTSINFSGDLLLEARSNVGEINRLYRKLSTGQESSQSQAKSENRHIQKLASFMESDIDFRSMFRELLIMVSEWNKGIDTMTPEAKASAVATLAWVNSFTNILKQQEGEGDFGKLVELMLRIREDLRGKKDFLTSDHIRSGLIGLGIYIEDKGERTIWWKE